MFGLSFEHLLILGIILLIFGPRRLPELGTSLGKAIRNFKEGFSEVKEGNVHQIENSEAKKIPASSNPARQQDQQPQQQQ